MAEEIKNLIQKIQEEGIQAAEEKARQIEAEAKSKAEVMLQEAKAEADKVLSEAREQIARMEQSSKSSIIQSSRDALLSLKKEITMLLERLVQSSVASALTGPEMARVIAELIKKLGAQGKEDIWILLKKEECEKLEKEFLSHLKEETKRGIVLKPSQDITGGFTISFDAGKSHFDFTDKALAEYLTSFLRPQLRQILEEKK